MRKRRRSDRFVGCRGSCFGRSIIAEIDHNNWLGGPPVSNNRKDKDGAIVEIKLWAGSEVLATVDCTTEQIIVGTTVSLNCFGADDMPASYDKITINDTF